MTWDVVLKLDKIIEQIAKERTLNHKSENWIDHNSFPGCYKVLYQNTPKNHSAATVPSSLYCRVYTKYSLPTETHLLHYPNSSQRTVYPLTWIGNSLIFQCFHWPKVAAFLVFPAANMFRWILELSLSLVFLCKKKPVTGIFIVPLGIPHPP